VNTITTQNPTWGFFGTLTTAEVANAGELFDATARALIAQLGLTPDEARLALDASVGRHMADQHTEGEDASALVARLIRQGWAGDIERSAGRPGKASKRSREILLRIQPDEASTLRYALDHGLSSISDAHPADRATLKGLIERLEAAERKARS